MDAGIQAKVLVMMKRMERAVATALSECAQAADWPAKRRGQAALVLTNAYVGLRVLARSGFPPKDLAAVIHMAMQGCGLMTKDRRQASQSRASCMQSRTLL
jgi:hypothetical protein